MAEQFYRFRDIKFYNQRENRVLIFASISKKKYVSYKRNFA